MENLRLDGKNTECTDHNGTTSISGETEETDQKMSHQWKTEGQRVVMKQLLSCPLLSPDSLQKEEKEMRYRERPELADTLTKRRHFKPNVNFLELTRSISGWVSLSSVI
jgi:hypothetical protein